jgi:hypothetical protein
MTTAGDPIGPQGGQAVVATYDGMPAARRAVSRLEEHGVEAANIRLLGDLAEKAVSATRTARRDSHFASFAARSMAAGFLIGGVVGAAAGAALGYFVYGLEQLALAGTAAAGFLAGSFIGFVLGAMTRVKQSEAWELTYQSVGKGKVSVGVRTRDSAEAEDAERALRSAKPLEFGRYEYDGRWDEWSLTASGGERPGGAHGGEATTDAAAFLRQPTAPAGAPSSAQDDGPQPSAHSGLPERDVPARIDELSSAIGARGSTPPVADAPGPARAEPRAAEVPPTPPRPTTSTGFEGWEPPPPRPDRRSRLVIAGVVSAWAAWTILVARRRRGSKRSSKTA